MHGNGIVIRNIRQTGRMVELSVDLEQKIYNALKDGDVIIYGAHLVAAELYRYLKYVSEKMNVCFVFAGFVVTSAEENPKELEGQNVIELQNFQKSREITMMLAMPRKYHQETENYAKELGFSSFIRVGLEEMSRLKGRQILQNSQKYEKLGFHLCEDRCDISWLNCYLYQDTSGQGNSLGNKYFKFPTLYYLDATAVYQEMKRFDFCREYERLFGNYCNLHMLPVYETSAGACHQLNIYMVFSQWDSIVIGKKEYPDWICPIHAGSVYTDKKTGNFLDETGDSISGKNHIFAEMTAAYWIWKNANTVKYKGLCHYRRHFVLSNDEVWNLERNGVDVILTIPRYAPGGIRRMFLNETPVKGPVYQIMREAVAECHPEDTETFTSYMEECLYFPNNMVVARSEIYDEYCQWIFSVLFRMADLDEESGYGHDKDRHIAYAAELLTSYFFTKCKGKYHVVVTDYKFYE